MLNIVGVEAQAQSESGNSNLAFIGDDRKRYDATLTNEARRHLLSLLQIEEARHLEAKHMALTVKDHTVGLSRQGNALVLSTRETGPIAFRIPPEMIAGLQQTLGRLGRLPQRS